MNKPSSYFDRLRRRKAKPAASRLQDLNRARDYALEIDAEDAVLKTRRAFARLPSSEPAAEF